MIHTAKQLKDKVRNVSKGDNEVAKALIRIFMMERFLERVSLSKYKNNFILKGGMLVASIVGVDMSVRRHIVGGTNRTLISVILPPRLYSPVGDRRLLAGQPHAVVALFQRQDSCF